MKYHDKTSIGEFRYSSDELADLVCRAGGERIRHLRRQPSRPGRMVPLPWWVPASVRNAAQAQGISQLWAHQEQAADLARRGQHVVVGTGTASGKTLCYLLPILADQAADAARDGSPDTLAGLHLGGGTALYLSPSKALAADHLARLESWRVPGAVVARYDGDTPHEQRRWAREQATFLLSNPDMLHRGILPGHQRWARWLRRLRYVVIDEAHTYRGVFGAHTAAVLRRLRRLAAHYGADPTFILTTATSAEPEQHAASLIGAPVAAVTDDTSAFPGRVVVLWEPALGYDEQGEARRDSTVGDVAAVTSELVTAGASTLAFARSRAGVEVVAEMVRARVAARDGEKIAAYRGGYLPEERAALERRLRDGDLRAVAATSALEVGIDIGGLDAVVMSGWPGTMASWWQQAGRAGRADRAALVVFVAGDDPLDLYLVNHPESLLDRPVDVAVVDPYNPTILRPHLSCAAAELPLTPADADFFGPDTVRLARELASWGTLRERPTGWYWTHPTSPAQQVALREGGEVVSIVDVMSGTVIGTVDEARSHTTVHTGAVYVHQGRTYVVTELCLDTSVASVAKGDPGWSTVARVSSSFAMVDPMSHVVHEWGPSVRVGVGPVSVQSQVTGFARRRGEGAVLGEHGVDLPPRVLPTQAVWWTMTTQWLAEQSVAADAVPGALHGAEHALIGLLPLVATADRWDIGGVSTARHPDTQLPTILIYDGYSGGAGFAARGRVQARRWLTMTADAVAGCRCDAGCPGCVFSPKCGNGNAPIDKQGALAVLRGLLAEMVRNTPSGSFCEASSSS